MSVHDSVLGRATAYPTQYDPTLLFAIARAEGRCDLGPSAPAFVSQGIDVWHVFELSWLDHSGKPAVAIGRLTVPADSPFLIESKSLKLYFNSLNFATFTNAQSVEALIIEELSKVAGAQVQFELLDVDALVTHLPQGDCLDHLEIVSTAAVHEPNPLCLMLDSTSSNPIIEETLYSNLLRSNCPVTSQPDWATVFIRYKGQKICQRSLLSYIVSYRKHSGFHEHCVEQIFYDIWLNLKPESLAVHAQYTRRGGLDINPCRSSDPTWLPKIARLARQ
jgi:7-cyano-7-deazaguanine reductase